MSTENTKGDVARREEAMLVFWREHDIFNKTLKYPGGTSVGPAQDSESKDPEAKAVKDFVFYDGPPFATGLPHYGHILAGTIKDAVPRFWTMNGYRIRRKWGWDCHGLPLENLIEKELGLATKRDIEEFGIQNFNEKARAAVLRYADDWRRIIPRMGRFVDMEDDYKTMDPGYTESVWWVFKTLHEKGLVYEGFKSMHLCPRCGTTLSNFEVNQGYKDIKDIAVFVELPLTMPLLADDEPTTSLIVWTTTPWTLPGNMAAAVHEEYEYIVVEKKDEGVGDLVRFVVAKERLEAIFGDDEYTVIKEIKGSDLVGKSYEPPFPYHSKREFENKENAWKIYHAPYVELGDEGTGAVHLAPAYGEEDMELAKEHGIPIVHHVSEGGHFKDFVTDFAGQLVKPKDDDDAGVMHLDADIEIVKKLKEDGTLFKKENITHSYPHCWRCDTPLLNYATTSWFVEVTKIRDELVSENKKVHWVPEHVGQNRFGKWLEGARDWAVSRQRYWGAPLPIWRNPKTKDVKIFGSLADVQEYVPLSKNTYFTMRHGESEKNIKGVATGKIDAPYPLTAKGIEEARQATTKLTEGVDLIITSPVMRAKETAELVAQELGLDTSSIIEDDRIRETEHGEYEGKSVDEYTTDFPLNTSKFTDGPADGETWTDIKKRMGDFLYSLEHEYKGKRILIISHGYPLAMLHSVVVGMSQEETVTSYESIYPDTGYVRTLDFTPFPHNDDYELDYHRPYIDNLKLYEDGVELERVPDVFDCWFESGSMPYAETHYPFENLDVADPAKGKRFPADFISESVDQTRGWFYSLTVLGVALFGKSPFENVITNGLVLAEDGKKMSKKLQNYPDPVELVDRQGADAMRFYLLSSSIIKGEDLNFSEKEVQELQRKNIGRLHNVLAMYETYAGEGVESRSDSTHVLDRWIIARLNELIAASTAGYKNYELDKATRPVTDFIDDLSVWYLRRSRDRLKSDDEADKQAALSTLLHVLQNLALVMAPAMPFYAEYLWQQVRGKDDAESVHLAKWPEGGKVDTTILKDMETARFVVTGALQERATEGIKVRQPLSLLKVTWDLDEPVATDISRIVADEVNVKSVEYQKQLSIAFQLDVNITPELQAEGDAREFMRQVQDMRKKAGLQPQDRIALTVQTSDGGEAIVTTFKEDIQRTTGADSIAFGDADGTEVVAGEHSFTVELRKV